MSIATTLVGHRGNVWASSFTLDSSHIATCSSDETVRVWEVKGGQPVVCLRGHRGVVRCCHFSPDSSLLASCSWDKSILLHRTADMQVKLELINGGLTLCHSYNYRLQGVKVGFECSLI